jgi:hypothetical protein
MWWPTARCTNAHRYGRAWDFRGRTCSSLSKSSGERSSPGQAKACPTNFSGS